MKNPYLYADGNPGLTFTLALAVRTIALPPLGFDTVPMPVSDQIPLANVPLQLTVPPSNVLGPPLLTVAPPSEAIGDAYGG